MRLDLVGDELHQVDSIWGRTRNGAKPAELNVYSRLDLVGDELDQVDSIWGRTRNGVKPAATLGRHLPLRATVFRERSSRQSRSQSFVSLDQRSENESSGSNHFRHAP